MSSLRGKSKIVIRCVNVALAFVSAYFLFLTTWRFDVLETGDSTEYVAMTEQFSTNGNVSFSEENMRDLQEKLEKLDLAKHFDYRKIPEWPKARGFTKRNGRYYSIHGFFYSVLASPIAVVLRIAGCNPFRASTILNSLLMVCTFWCCWLFFPGGLKYRLLALALTVFSPVYFYLIWPHTEIMLFACVVLSSLAALNSKFKTAIFIAAIATSCNATLFLYLFVLGLLFLRNQYILFKNRAKLKITDFAIVFASGALSLIQPLYFYSVFGVPNLIPAIINFSGLHAASPEYMSLERVFSLFFDLNQGIVLGALPVVIISVLFAIYQIFTFRTRLLWLPAVTLALAYATTSVQNWNPGGVNVCRYGVWMSAFLVVYATASLYQAAFSTRVKYIIALVAVLISTVQFAFIRHKPTMANQHSPVAKYVLNKFPRMYNPEIDIFVTRCRGREFAARDLTSLSNTYVAYTNNTTGFITKILATDDTFANQKFETADVSWRQEVLSSLRTAPHEPQYINPGPGLR